MLKTARLFNRLWYTPACSFTRVRRAKTFKLTQYPVIPPWSKIIPKDPFEYKLRPKEEVIKELENPPEFPIKLIYIDYPRARQETADKARKMKIELNMEHMDLTKLQRKRLVQLLGPRYNGTSKFELSSEMYATPEQNLVKVLEMARELYWEAKRAP